MTQMALGRSRIRTAIAECHHPHPPLLGSPSASLRDAARLLRGASRKVRVGSRRESLARLSDRLKDSFEVAEDVAVREANHSETSSLQCARPGVVVVRLIWLSMRVSINFDAQPSVGTVEVGDVAAQEKVPPPDVKSKLVISEPAPEFLFGRRERVTQLAGLA